MNINEIINNNQKYLFIRFGKSRVDSGAFEVEMILGELEQNDKPYSKSILLLHYFKAISKKTITVWASYQYIGWFKEFDIIKNGKPIIRLSDHSNNGQAEFYAEHTTYVSGHNIKELSAFNGPFWLELKNQVFAVVKSPDENKKYIIPCAEIYRACFGKYESAVLDATFLGIEVYNPEYTIVGNEERNPIGYIHLRKQFTEKSALFGYRLYSNKSYFKSFANTTADLRIKHEILTKFPVIVFNEVTFNYFEVTENLYYIPKLNGVKLEGEIITKIEFDTDNSKGKGINEDTKSTPSTKTVGIKSNPNLDVNALPTVNGPTDGLLTPVNLENQEEERDPFTIPVEKVSKEFKKTITTKAKILIKDPKRKGFSDGIGNDPDTIKTEYNLINTSYSFESLKELFILLKEEACFTSVKYFKNKDSLPLVLKDEPKQDNWAYLLSTSDNSFYSRNIGVIEMCCDNSYYYLIEIQSKNTESFAMGLVSLQNPTELTDVEFKNLRQEIIHKKGVFKKFSKVIFKPKYLKHFGERNLTPKKTEAEKKLKIRVEKTKDEKNKIVIKNIIMKINPTKS